MRIITFKQAKEEGLSPTTKCDECKENEPMFCVEMGDKAHLTTYHLCYCCKQKKDKAYEEFIAANKSELVEQLGKAIDLDRDFFMRR